jgi:hypothetical protein
VAREPFPLAQPECPYRTHRDSPTSENAQVKRSRGALNMRRLFQLASAITHHGLPGCWRWPSTESKRQARRCSWFRRNPWISASNPPSSLPSVSDSCCELCRFVAAGHHSASPVACTANLGKFQRGQRGGHNSSAPNQSHLPAQRGLRDTSRVRWKNDDRSTQARRPAVLAVPGTRAFHSNFYLLR